MKGPNPMTPKRSNSSHVHMLRHCGAVTLLHSSFDNVQPLPHFDLNRSSGGGVLRVILC
jgi:hypothetical protein